MQENLIRWLAGGRRGVSSNTMVQHLTGLPALGGRHGDHPHDPDDMTRCRRLLDEVPELQSEFHRMATYSGPWAKLVKHWQELCDLMDDEAPRWREGQGRSTKTYERMRELIEAGRLADGWTQTSPGCWSGPNKQQETTIGAMTIAVVR